MGWPLPPLGPNFYKSRRAPPSSRRVGRRREGLVGISCCGEREGGALSVFLILLCLGFAIREEAFRGSEAGGDSLEIEFFWVF